MISWPRSIAARAVQALPFAPQKVPLVAATISETAKRDFSLTATVKAMAEGKELSGLEREVSQEMRQRKWRRGQPRGCGAGADRGYLAHRRTQLVGTGQHRRKSSSDNGLPAAKISSSRCAQTPRRLCRWALGC